MKQERSWTEYFRIITPFLLLVITGFSAVINSRLVDIDTKLFKHLTNDEIHTPKSVVVSKGEFAIYQEMRNEQIRDLRDDLMEIKSILKNGPCNAKQ